MYYILREEGKVLVETDPLWDPEKHTFTYQLNQVTFELYDEQQILYPPPHTITHYTPTHFSWHSKSFLVSFSNVSDESLPLHYHLLYPTSCSLTIQ